MDRRIESLRKLFPRFVHAVDAGAGAPLEQVLPGIAESEIAAIEARLGINLPASYKAFLLCTGGFWLMGGVVQMSGTHPFFHDFAPLDALTRQQRRVVAQRGGIWPPASNGMLCFAEFFMEADGDQLLFDVRRPGADAECPVMYYAHDASPPSVRQIAANFREWLEGFLDYPQFRTDADA